MLACFLPFLFPFPASDFGLIHSDDSHYTIAYQVVKGKMQKIVAAIASGFSPGRGGCLITQD
jgi:hypothetical protein